MDSSSEHLAVRGLNNYCQIYCPINITVYITDKKHSVHYSNGQFIKCFSTQESGEGELNCPRGVEQHQWSTVCVWSPKFIIHCKNHISRIVSYIKITNSKQNPRTCEIAITSNSTDSTQPIYTSSNRECSYSWASWQAMILLAATTYTVEILLDVLKLTVVTSQSPCVEGDIVLWWQLNQPVLILCQTLDSWYYAHVWLQLIMSAEVAWCLLGRAGLDVYDPFYTQAVAFALSPLSDREECLRGHSSVAKCVLFSTGE